MLRWVTPNRAVPALTDVDVEALAAAGIASLRGHESVRDADLCRLTGLADDTRLGLKYS